VAEGMHTVVIETRIDTSNTYFVELKWCAQSDTRVAQHFIPHATTCCNGWMAQALDYLLIIDFEATCDEGTSATPNRSHRVIIIRAASSSWSGYTGDYRTSLASVRHKVHPHAQQCTFVQTLRTHRSGEVIAFEQHYVLPALSAELTPFCVQLTGLCTVLWRVHCSACACGQCVCGSRCAVTGITTELLQQKGVPLQVALQKVHTMTNTGDQSANTNVENCSWSNS
jgi:hypothetical protein